MAAVWKPYKESVCRLFLLTCCEDEYTRSFCVPTHTVYTDIYKKPRHTHLFKYTHNTDAGTLLSPRTHWTLDTVLCRLLAGVL